MREVKGRLGADGGGLIMEIATTKLSGVYVIQPLVRGDARGSFTKTIQGGFFKERGLNTRFDEIYHSVSHSNVLRGLHFQIPPADGSKMVCCLSGTVHDVLLDLRRSSATYGQHLLVKLEGDKNQMVYMPAGVAHGFWVESGPSIMLYYQQKEYAAQQDRGILWNSAGIVWPCQNPIISDRDAAFPMLKDYVSPFG